MYDNALTFSAPGVGLVGKRWGVVLLLLDNSALLYWQSRSQTYGINLPVQGTNRDLPSCCPTAKRMPTSDFLSRQFHLQDSRGCYSPPTGHVSPVPAGNNCDSFSCPFALQAIGNRRQVQHKHQARASNTMDATGLFVDQ